MANTTGSTLLAAILAAAMPLTVGAQDALRAARKSCVRARPAPDCRAFFITNLGVYKVREFEPLPLVWDVGKMVNVNPRHAYGGSWFVTFDGDGLVTGPVARYRRWLERGRSLDLAIGTPVVSSEGFAAGTKPGSILGLVKYNPVNWFGVALRPNYLRREKLVCGSPGVCARRPSNSVRVIAGVEVGGVPGLVLSLAGGAVGLALSLALAGT